MSENNETKTTLNIAPHVLFETGNSLVNSKMFVFNTATGCVVCRSSSGRTLSESTVFIPGEHWDAEAGKFRSLTKGVTP